MRWHARRNGYRRDMIAMSGWLFADLLLGLAMLFLVFNTVGSVPTATSTSTFTPTRTPTLTPYVRVSPTATSMPTDTPTPTPTPTSLPKCPVCPPAGLDANAVKLIIRVDPQALLNDDPAQVKFVVEQIKQHFGQYEGVRQAGIVLTFGTSSNPAEGNRLAAKVNELLRTTLPEVFVPAGRPGETAFEDFHSLSADPGQKGEVEIRTYLLLQSGN